MKNKAVLAASIAFVLLALVFVWWRHGREPRRRPMPGKRPAVKRAAAKKAGHPLVAIVMDDFGYNASELDEFFALKKPITLSILPNLPFSAETALAAHSRGYEVILHLPLESKGAKGKEESDTIRTGMKGDEVTRMLDQEIATVPGIKGVSNHMGSKATGDMALMDTIMNDLKKRDLYFFDSLTSNRSICKDAAARAGVRFARRDVFLDMPNDISHIRKQMQELRRVAFKKGRAIAVCHYRSNTIKALAETMPGMAEDGIRFVKLSELLN